MICTKPDRAAEAALESAWRVSASNLIIAKHRFNFLRANAIEINVGKNRNERWLLLLGMAIGKYSKDAVLTNCIYSIRAPVLAAGPLSNQRFETLV